MKLCGWHQKKKKQRTAFKGNVLVNFKRGWTYAWQKWNCTIVKKRKGKEKEKNLIIIIVFCKQIWANSSKHC